MLRESLDVADGIQTLRRGHRQAPGPKPFLGALQRARQCLLSLQKPDGHWCGELQGDTILESEYILLMAFLRRDQEDRVRKAGRYILSQQRPEGAWSNYPGGPDDLSVSVKAYFALKVAGHRADVPYMRRACAAIRALGGAACCNSFTKFYLAFLGQFPYENCATVPAEMMFLPKWAYINLYAMSSWTRTIVVPLSIFSAFKPVRKLPSHQGIAELFLEPQHKKLLPHPPTKRLFTATNSFLAVDQVLKWVEKWGPRQVRQAAVARASSWMRRHFGDSDGVGAIYPPIIYTIISLHCLGYAKESPEMVYALKQLDDLMIEEEDSLRVQPCFSPVWDTALSVNALSLARGAGEERLDDAVARATRWLIDREVRRPGDWSLLNPGLEPSGWFFEYRNGFYPDIDDTAMVLMGLARSGHAWERPAKTKDLHQHWHNGAAKHVNGTPSNGTLANGKAPVRVAAAERGLHWLLGMQNRDGGWAAFDRNINRDLLTKIPFADHNAMLDPSCPDITARVLEALGQFGYRVGNPQVDRALAFIEKTQDRRGCWLGRWGVNYIYGTWQVLLGLHAVHVDKKHAMVQRSIAWLKRVQQPSGAWGESCRSYNDPATAGQGPPTASQTAWALIGLMAAGEGHSDAVRRGIDYLVATQQADGNWHEDQFTGTGFPKVFYLKYHLYRLYFPLMALARFQQCQAENPARNGRKNGTPNYSWSAA
ncbi:MAG TPA: terpene cyclase/mutase family protein [Gemmataceae bacterium]|nr:terpene cyclase/mutase family protein [Gemmataceae bacterium]